ncbi:type III-A CRISPR-associated protein Csm2 [uncultured Ligilactobacillus sp.]|uniref:type III-A CRISPR-associated protein Csm2 n=1 Tax=uncultured Ligilactobacillus sp. TaxID=2837633 RepID=UPI00272C9083|nr:type III-A CRISPR-associated protein Csm2 [uncultured Ligilactobacillus sp.]
MNVNITKFDDSSYVGKAENVIKEMKRENFKKGRDTLTTSQLRKLLSMTGTLYDRVQFEGLEKVMDRIAYLRIQFIYQGGRNAAVKEMIDKAEILAILEKVQKNQEKADFIRFCHYMEALVAYFKYYGGRDR